MQKQYESEDNKKFPFLIEQKSENKVIGGIGLNSIDNIQGTGSLGYWINKKYHKKGYASEALKPS
jgi:RimJ/RimL family protein N-acetyltransferase